MINRIVPIAVEDLHPRSWCVKTGIHDNESIERGLCVRIGNDDHFFIVENARESKHPAWKRGDAELHAIS